MGQAALGHALYCIEQLNELRFNQDHKTGFQGNYKQEESDGVKTFSVRLEPWFRPAKGAIHRLMLDFVDSPGAPEAALWCAVLWRAWEDLQHPRARIRRDASAFFAGPDFDRIAALTPLKAEAIALIRETARQWATGHEAPVSNFSRKPTHAYQRRSHYLVRYLEYQGEVRPLQDWCRRLRLKPMTVYVRLHRGWTVAEALTGRRESRLEPATPRQGGETSTTVVLHSAESGQ